MPKRFDKYVLVYYDENGNDPMELSSIDTEEFEKCLKDKI